MLTSFDKYLDLPSERSAGILFRVGMQLLVASNS
jgi:hypothetical protein